MSLSTNTVVLAGNLATDVRLRTTATDKQVASFKLAVNRPGKDAGADFMWVKVWNGSAVACNQYIGKGDPVLVEGSISSSRVAETNGGFREYFEVNARQVTFLPKGNGNSPVGAPPMDEDVPESEADAQAKAIAEARATLAALEADSATTSAAPGPVAMIDVPETVVEDDDDIPF